MIPHLVRDNTPQGLYKWVQENSKITINSLPVINGLFENAPEQPVHYANLTKTCGYKKLFPLIGGLFIVFGVCVVVLIAACVMDRKGIIQVRQFPFSILPYTTFGFLGAAMLVTIVGAIAESMASHKDTSINDIGRVKTFILNDGHIVVSDEKHKGRIQKFIWLGDDGYSDEYIRQHSEWVPFNRLDIIDRVYRLSRKNGRFTALVHCKRYYLYFPYRDDNNTDPLIECIYELRWKSCITFLTWYESISSIDELGRYLKIW